LDKNTFKMRIFGLALLAALGFSVPSVKAFTNGTLLPSYLCNDVDGYPKSAGTLIPFLQLGTAADNYNQFPPGNATKPIIAFGDNVIANVTAIAPTARQIVGAFDNGGAQLDANGNVVTPVNYEKAMLNAVWLAPQVSNALNGQGDYTIQLGKINTFVVASHCPAPDPRGYNNAGVALDGFMAYAVDMGTGQRVGSWINVGPTFSQFYACNPKGNALPAVGIVHNQLASGNSNVANLTWMAPPTAVGPIMFKGAGVSDCGFGPFQVIFNTTSNKNAPSLAAQNLTANTDVANFAAYVNKTVGPDLPGAAMAFALQGANPTTTSNAVIYFPAQTAGIGIAGAVAGAIVAGTVAFFVGRRRKTTGGFGGGDF
jgi:hypothetical protein